MEKTAWFRFYEELNDFLPEKQRKRDIAYHFEVSPSVKDAIEALGVPHVEVDLILANGNSVGFGYLLQDGDRIAVYPVFESIDITPISKLPRRPLREPKFVLDVHLGKLARLLRMLGFDARYRNDYDDPEIVYIARKEKRAILTRDRGLLKKRVVSHGYWVRSDHPPQQVREVLQRFDLFDKICPFHRCMRCNGVIEAVEKTQVLEQLQPKTRRYYREFYRCRNCGQVYWKGSHFRKMEAFIRSLGKP